MDIWSPRTLAEAMGLLTAGNCKILAGGTDFLVKNPDLVNSNINLVSICDIKELKDITLGDSFIEMGSALTHSEIMSCPVVLKHAPILAAASSNVGSVQIRNKGTLGGNVVTSSPAGDTLTALYVLNAKLVLASNPRERTIPIGEFISGPGQNILAKDELVTKIIIEQMQANEVWVYKKVGLRNALAISVLGAAVRGILQDGGFSRLQITMGSVAPTIVNLDDLAASLIGRKFTRVSLWEALKDVEAYINPISDVRASMEYRLLTARTVLFECLCEMLGMQVQK